MATINITPYDAPPFSLSSTFSLLGGSSGNVSADYSDSVTVSESLSFMSVSPTEFILSGTEITISEDYESKLSTEVSCLPFGGAGQYTYISLERNIYEVLPGGSGAWSGWSQVKSFQFTSRNNPRSKWGYIPLERKEAVWTEGGAYIDFPSLVYLVYSIEWLDLHCPQDLMQFLFGDHGNALGTSAASWLQNVDMVSGWEKRRIKVYPRGLLATDRVGGYLTGIEMKFLKFPLAEIERWQNSHMMNAGKLEFISARAYSHSAYQALTTWGNP